MAFSRRETLILLIGDFCLLAASLWLALIIRNLSLPSLGYFTANALPFLPMFLLSLLVFYVAGLYEKQTRPIRSVMGVRILGAQGATVAIAAVLFFILPLSIAPKTILALYLAVSIIAESAWRFYRMSREIKDEERESAVLFGSGAEVRELYEEVNGNDRYLLRFTELREEAGPARAEITGAGERGLLDFATLYEEVFDRVPLEHSTTQQLASSYRGHYALYDKAKRLFDVLLALALVLFAVPFVLFGALGRLVTGTPVFFLHERIGKGGKRFTLVKLSSMQLNDHGDPELQKENSVTAFGYFLRKTRIDELPQLWNVLTGDLSFIGPRPELPTLVQVYEREIPLYSMRHLVTPGLSGWAQIHDYDAPRGGVDVARTRKKLSFDLYYLKHRSFGLDLAIAVKTIRTLLAFVGT
jgi:lipopolysaccharide/colanic/teichoic acid biosynthesis glycosyltransferase